MQFETPCIVATVTSTALYSASPENTIRCTNVGLVLAHCLGCVRNNKPQWFNAGPPFMTLNHRQLWGKVGPPSVTLSKHYFDFGPMYCVLYM